MSKTLRQMRRNFRTRDFKRLSRKASLSRLSNFKRLNRALLFRRLPLNSLPCGAGLLARRLERQFRRPKRL